MLDDLLRRDLHIVFCGTAASRISAHTGHYYANPGNKFYRTLHAIGLTDRELKPENYKSLLDYGIGLTDLNKIDSGMDHQLSPRNFDVDAFRQKMLRFEPRVISFTSKRGAQVYFDRVGIDYGEQTETLNEIRIFVLPSTSGANASWKTNEHHWESMRRLF
jgi:double-stranded uracil-DNA glycosylase